MPYFPLFRNLPQVPQELVFQFVDKVDLFYYSLISKNCLNLIESLNIKAQVLKWDLHDDSSKAEGCIDSITLRFKDCWNLIFYLNSISEKEWSAKRRKVREICGIKVIIERGEGIGLYFNSTASSAQMIRVFSEYFQKIFKVEKLGLRSQNALSEIFLPYLNDNMPFSELELYFEDEDEDGTPIVSNFQVSFELLKILLKDITVTWKFTLQVPVEDGATYSYSLKHKEIRLQHAKWLTIDCLIGMKCEILEAFGSHITAEDVQRFIEDWLKGGYEKLETIYLWSPNESYEAIFNNSNAIPFVEWPEDLPPRPEFHNHYSCKNGRNIRRKSDGLIATIVVSSGRFKFLVWQEKFLKK